MFNSSSFQRLKAITEEHVKIFTKAREGAKKEGEGEGITKAYVSYCMGVALDDKEGDDTIIFNEYPLDHSLVPRRKPNSWFENSNASGLGWSFGACIGGKVSTFLSCLLVVSLPFCLLSLFNFVLKKYSWLAPNQQWYVR
jgi:hypothetical protein